MQPGSSLTGLGGVPGSVPTGFDAGAKTAQGDLSDPASSVSKPIAEVGKLPVLSSLGTLPTLPTLGSSTPEKSTSTVFTSPKKVSTDSDDDDAPKSGSSGVTPAHRFTDRLNDAVKKVTGGLSGAHKDATKDSSGDAAGTD